MCTKVAIQLQSSTTPQTPGENLVASCPVLIRIVFLPSKNNFVRIAVKTSKYSYYLLSPDKWH